jgi:hypothetical protein
VVHATKIMVYELGSEIYGSWGSNRLLAQMTRTQRYQFFIHAA